MYRVLTTVVFTEDTKVCILQAYFQVLTSSYTDMTADKGNY